MTDAELETLQQWIANGAPEGDARDLPPAPDWGSGWRLGTPDLIVSMPASYAVRADGTDVFRTFVIPIPIARARFVRALEFHPGNPRVVHHANLGVDRTKSSRQLAARNPEGGYDGSMERDARYPEGQLLGWTPGRTGPNGGSSPTAISSSSCTCSRRARPNRCGCRSACTSPTRRRRARRSASGWAARRSTFPPASATT
jgi:hypothetical protein